MIVYVSFMYPSNMTGIEFSLLLVQEPILYVIRKVHRQSPDKGEIVVVMAIIIIVRSLYIQLCHWLITIY